MDSSSSSISQDGTISTSNESSPKHMLTHDIAAFGVPSEISGLHLPTKLDILRHYFYLVKRAKIRNNVFPYKTFSPHVTDKLVDIWSQLDIPVLINIEITRKLNSFLDNYRNEEKNKTTSSTYAEFVRSTKDVFHIGKCKCDLKAALCSCELIPQRLKEFMLDQNNDRKLTVPEYAIEIVEQIPMTPMPTFELSGDEGHDVFNFAMACDKFGVHDNVASALATGLFKDFAIKDNCGNPLVMDESKVRAEKDKCRQEVLRKRYDPSNLLAFSFDDRNDGPLTNEKTDKKHHSKKDSHLVVRGEPHSQLIGYTKVENDDSAHKVTKLNEFFVDKAISLDALIGICCDGEPVNTDIDHGIIRRFEMQVKRPLHWLVCLLQFNEQAFQHLFDHLEHSSTTGRSRSTTGKLSKQIETCEDLPVCNCFNLFITVFDPIS